MPPEYLFGALQNEPSEPFPGRLVRNHRGVDAAGIAELQVLLEGVSLPGDRSSLVRYARSEGATGEQIALLQRLPERRYETIDEVAEELVSVQPPDVQKEPRSPREESGEPPGGDAYTQLRPESRAVRD
jgi:Protein of unknown function (DUF2795)